ncbi:hypothetical protein OG216_02535 [Streptomycetaceae bacterium NBC_01309]
MVSTRKVAATWSPPRDRATARAWTRAELAAFLDGAKSGEFDHLVD